LISHDRDNVPCSSSGFIICLGRPRKMMAVCYAGDNAKPEGRLWPSFEDSVQRYRVSFDETDPLVRLYLALRGIVSNFALDNFLLNIHSLPPLSSITSSQASITTNPFSSQFTLTFRNWLNRYLLEPKLKTEMNKVTNS